MNHNFQSLRRIFFQTSLIAALLASFLALQLLGPIAGIKSGYVLIGLIFAVIIYYNNAGTRDERNIIDKNEQNSDSLYHITLVLVCISVVAVVAAEFFFPFDPSMARTGGLVVALPIGYTLVCLQLRRGTSINRLLTQVVALFLFDPLSKYLSTGFYFGRGDIPKHVYYTDLITTSGTWQTIPQSSFYRFFPGLQTLSGSVSLLTGFNPYDSLVLTGIVTYFIMICISYLIAKLLFSNELLAVCIALGVSTLSPVHRYSVYFYPQALTVVLILVLILLSVRYSVVTHTVIKADGGGRTPTRYLHYGMLMPPIIVALWFTHHLTVVLFFPIILGLTVAPLVARQLFAVRDVVRPLALPLAIWIAGSVAYWFVQDVFVSTLIESFDNVLGQSRFAGTSGAGATVETLGRQIPGPSINDAVLSLASPGGIYNIMLVCTLAFGLVSILRHPTRYRRAGGFVTVGVAGAVLMLRVPIDLHGLARTQLPLSMFVAFVIGAGLYRLVSPPPMPYKKVLPGIIVFVLLATAGPAVAADDLYVLHSGPNLWETQTLPEPQKEYTAAEMESFQLSSAYIERYDVTVGTDWPSSNGLTRYGESSEPFLVENEQIRTDQDLLMYRQRWTDHSVRLIPDQAELVTVLISEDWMGELVWSENKVYTTGEVGMLEDRAGETKLRTA